MSKGFVTIASGRDAYYKMASNLLTSYRLHSKEPLPFTIVCDRENKWTEAFDNVVVRTDLSMNYMDKLSILSNPPYDENIFIDADSLAYRDLNDLFALMPREGVACVGRKLPTTDTENGWFAFDNIGVYKNRVRFIPQMHGGIIFFRNDNLTARIHADSIHIAANYSNFKFRYFQKPADEPVLSLAIAANSGCLVEVEEMDTANIYAFYPSVAKVISDMPSGMLTYINRRGERIDNVYLCHWQNRYTRRSHYKRDVLMMTLPVGVARHLRLRTNRVKDAIYFMSGSLRSLAKWGLRKIVIK